MANNCKQCFNTHYQPHCHPTAKSLWLCSSVYCGPPHQSRRIWLPAEAGNQKQFFVTLLGKERHRPTLRGGQVRTRWSPKSLVSVLMTIISHFTLQWHHNERDGISNHRHLDCLLNRLFRRRSKETSTLCLTDLCEGNSPVTSEFPCKWPVMWKMFLFNDVIMSLVCS